MLNRLVPETLAVRLFLVFAACLMLVVGGGLGVAYRTQFAQRIADAHATADIVIDVAAQAAVDNLARREPEALRRTLAKAVASTPFKSAVYIDSSGGRIGYNATEALFLAPPAWLREMVAERLPSVNRDIVVDGRGMGVLRLIFSVDRMAADLWDAIGTALAVALAGLIAGLLVTRWLLARWLGGLEGFDDVASRIRAGSIDAAVSITRESPVEIRRAAELLNSATSSMRDQFGQRIDVLMHALLQHKNAIDRSAIVCELDVDGRILQVNDRYCDVTGEARDAVLGRDWRFMHAHEVAAPDLDATVREQDITCERADGSVFWLKSTVVPIFDGGGGIEKYICIDIETTREKRGEARLREQKRQAEVTLDSIADGVIATDAAGRITYANPGAGRALGLDADDLPGHALGDWFGRFAPDAGDNGAWINRRDEVDAGAGGRRIVESTLSHLEDAGGARGGYVLALRDVTRASALQSRLQQLSSAVENSASGIYITDLEARIEYVNPRFCELSGYAAGEIVGLTPAVLKSGRTPPEVYVDLWSTLRAGNPWRGQLLNRRKDGTQYWCMQAISVVRDGQGVPVNYVAVSEDISERKEAEEKIHRLAYFDSLTELPNRRHFFERVEERFRLARRGDAGFAILHFDLFNFKDVNDSLGHAAGDELLREVGRRLQACLLHVDFVARLGGDEFAVLVPNVANAQAAGPVIERIFSAIEAAFLLRGAEVFVSSSMGVSLYPDNGADATTLLKNADMALYRAKAMGKRACVFFSIELERKNRERAELERELRHALERGELSLEYQPKYHLGFERVVGAEALLRWHHPVLGQISPLRFIPVAEESQLIVPIGKWVVEEVCRQIRRWENAGLPPIQVALNLSPVQFRSAGLFDDISGILERAEVLPGQIELEITESLLMDDPEAAVGMLNRLRNAGFSLAIDDFGTGYSSLAYLKRFPVAVLKIDRSFVKDLSQDMDDRAIAAAVVSMAASLLLDVVAEGVETIEQLDILRELGCDYIQGYYISKPLPGDRFAQFMMQEGGPIPGRGFVGQPAAVRPALEAPAAGALS
jgi:diguanylate cyclase (GGDEF)-like protein/PAS domain S-box-containing protein